MKTFLNPAVAASLITLAATGAQAASFAGFTATADIIFDDAAVIDFLPGVSGLILDLPALLDVTLDDTGIGGFVTVFDALLPAEIYDGTIIAAMASFDAFGVDEISYVIETAPGFGPTDYAIGTFAGNLDGAGLTDFFIDGVLFEEGRFVLTGAVADPIDPIPVPASLPLLLAACGGMALLRRSVRPRQRGA